MRFKPAELSYSGNKIRTGHLTVTNFCEDGVVLRIMFKETPMIGISFEDVGRNSNNGCNVMVKASIIIRAYNEEKHIGKLLYGLHHQDFDDFEIILVDSGSTDNTVSIAEQHGARIVHIAKSEFSFGRALNLGCAAAHGEFLVIVSAHVYPVACHWLLDLLAPFEDEATTLSYGKQRGGGENKYSELRIFETWFPNQSEVPQKGYFCNNANCAIRKHDWSNQRYDEDLTGLEDLHWAKQAIANGKRIAYVATAEIIHVHDESWSQVRNRYRREAIAMKIIEGDRVHFNLFSFINFFAKNSLTDMRTAHQHGDLFDKWPEILRFRFNQFWGTYQGFKSSSDEIKHLRRRFYYPTNGSNQTPVSQEQSDAIDYSAWS